MSSEKSFYRSGELAELAGVSSDTLRHYERKGVLARPLRKANNYRLYPTSALQRVRLILRAIAVGFTLDELASVLSVRDRLAHRAQANAHICWKPSTPVAMEGSAMVGEAQLTWPERKGRRNQNESSTFSCYRNWNSDRRLGSFHR